MQECRLWNHLDVDSVKAELQVFVSFTFPCTSMKQKFLGNKETCGYSRERGEVLQKDSQLLGEPTGRVYNFTKQSYY